MSSVIRIQPRERWAARDAMVVRWLKEAGGTFRWGDPIADIVVDGRSRTVVYQQGPESSDPAGGIYALLVQEGHQIGPWGHLLEYTDWPADRSSGPSARHRAAPARFVRREQYPRVFLSYRKDDGEAYAGRLHETLIRAFGADDVFMDLFSIRPGELFAMTIQQAAWHARVMVVLVGPKWVSEQKFERGEMCRRLDDDHDYVRREITAALDTGTVVIPLLLPGAILPAQLNLPTEMLTLGDMQALELTTRHWESDTAVVIAAIRSVLEQRTIEAVR